MIWRIWPNLSQAALSFIFRSLVRWLRPINVLPKYSANLPSNFSTKITLEQQVWRFLEQHGHLSGRVLELVWGPDFCTVEELHCCGSYCGFAQTRSCFVWMLKCVSLMRASLTHVSSCCSVYFWSVYGFTTWWGLFCQHVTHASAVVVFKRLFFFVDCFSFDKLTYAWTIAHE